MTSDAAGGMRWTDSGTGVAADGGLRAGLGVERDRFDLAVDLAVAPGRVLALLGPNGAGKSTALRALAGLVPLTYGQIRLAGDVLDDPARATFVPADERPVGMVFQDYLLFPHLSVLDNVAFGLRARGTGRRTARERAATWVERVGLTHVAKAKPAAVSGGEAQRAALARALATDPTLLLLDEPLAALDASTRLQIRSDLRRHLAGYHGCTVLVTHDPLDAMVLADDLVVVEDGRAVQSGPPGEVARAPRTDYVARLVGLNLYRGYSRGTTVSLDGGGALVTTEPAEGPVCLAFPPAAVALHLHRPDGSPRNAWAGRITGIEHHRDTVRVHLDGQPPVLADVTPGAVADLALGADQQVWAAVKATEIHCYPA